PKLSKINPESLTASYYEYLIYPLFLLLKPLYSYLAPQDSTAFEFLNYTVMLWGQMFSGVIGFIFIPKILWDIYKSKREYFFLILLLILGLKGMNWIWVTAKNDSFPLFCILVSYRFFIKSPKYANQVLVTFFSFFLLGIGLGA